MSTTPLPTQICTWLRLAVQCLATRNRERRRTSRAIWLGPLPQSLSSSDTTASVPKVSVQLRYWMGERVDRLLD